MNKKVHEVKTLLLERYETLEQKSDILKSRELRELFALIPQVDIQERAALGQEINTLQQELKSLLARDAQTQKQKEPIDVTAPMDVNAPQPVTFNAQKGSIHPITQEIQYMSDILQRMGFRVYESRELDDQYHMFDTLNFPKGHPARDDYDTFMTEETDENGDQFVAPAHTSTMQNRIMKELRGSLEKGEPIAATSIDRVFRNEDLDARHEHTFYQHEGIYISENVHAGMIVSTLQTFLQEYFGKDIDARVNPFYFPFTEPSFEFSLGCPFCEGNGCKVCSQSGWIELLGCGMIHPNVLKQAGIDSKKYSGFAWGGGVERLIMMKHNIEDIRHFQSAKLDFLRQF